MYLYRTLVCYAQCVTSYTFINWFTCTRMHRNSHIHKGERQSIYCLIRWDFKKQWAGAILIVKCCCFVQIWLLVMQFWTGLSEEEKERIGCLATFWFSTFAVLFLATRHVVDHENTWRRMVCCLYISLPFRDFERLFVLSYTACLRYPYI